MASAGDSTAEGMMGKAQAERLLLKILRSSYFGFIDVLSILCRRVVVNTVWRVVQLLC